MLITLLLLVDLLLLSGDVHPNPGPPSAPSNKSLSIYFINAQSIKANTKYVSGVNQFRHMTDILEPDIIAVNESWLIPEIPNSEFADGDIYAVYRKDRTDIRGGGVLILVKKSIWSKERTDLESPDPNNNEIKIAEIKPTPSRSIAAITAYRSQTNPCPDFLNNLDTVITNCLQNNIVEFIILGDLNYSQIKWEQNVDTNLSKNSKDLIAYLQQHNLRQLNRHPSREGEDNILDLIITNLPDDHSDITCGRYKYVSDHLLLDYEIQMKVNRKNPSPRRVFNYKRANMVALSEELMNVTYYGNPTDSTNSSWSKFKRRVINLSNRYIPQITIRNKYSPAWIDADVVHASHRKKCALNKSKRTNRPQDKLRFKYLRNQLKNLVSRKYKEHIANITNSIGTNPKRFWTLLKDRSKTQSSPTIITKDGVDHTNPDAKSHILNEHFHNVFTNATHDLPPSKYPI